MQYEGASKEISAVASILATLNTDIKEELSLLGTLLGALYGLQRAVELDFLDRTGSALPTDYTAELSDVARQIARGKVAESQWLAGFYFNSAIHRLAALNERLTKYVFGSKKDVCADLRKENNKFKHEIEGLISGREIDIPKAVSAVTKLAQVMKNVVESN
jgi:hypothetical protein